MCKGTQFTVCTTNAGASFLWKEIPEKSRDHIGDRNTQIMPRTCNKTKPSIILNITVRLATILIRCLLTKKQVVKTAAHMESSDTNEIATINQVEISNVGITHLPNGTSLENSSTPPQDLRDEWWIQFELPSTIALPPYWLQNYWCRDTLYMSKHVPISYKYNKFVDFRINQE